MNALRASLLTVFILLSQLAAAGAPEAGQPAESVPTSVPVSAPSIAIIIDDLGYSLKQGRRAIALPGAVTCSILPGTPHAHLLAQQAKAAGKEIMLHLPMQGTDTRHIEPDSLSSEMTEADFRDVLRRQLAAIPEAAGVNNHMGSTLTPLADRMNWLMEELSQHSLYFVDSRTTSLTVGADAAHQHHVPFTQRDVFLDNDKDPVAIEKAFDQLIRKALKHGHAVGIAHAHPVTLATLEMLLPKLAEEGIVLEPVSKLLPQKEVQAVNLTAQNQGAATTTPQSTR
jgi:polysaccharide deacetylase 2 family uncharacterized protein YibQ